MWKLLRRFWPRPRLAVARPVTRHQAGGSTYTHTGLAVHVTLFGGGVAPVRPGPRRAPPRPSPLMDRLFGPKVPPLTAAQVRALPVARDALTEARALTGDRYPGRQAVAAARAAAQERQVSGAARVVAPRLAKSPTIQVPGKKPIKVKAHTRADGTRVHAHTRVRPGEGS